MNIFQIDRRTNKWIPASDLPDLNVLVCILHFEDGFVTDGVFWRDAKSGETGFYLITGSKLMKASQPLKEWIPFPRPTKAIRKVVQKSGL